MLKIIEWPGGANCHKGVRGIMTVAAFQTADFPRNVEGFRPMEMSAGHARSHPVLTKQQHFKKKRNISCKIGGGGDINSHEGAIMIPS